jgi:multiple sugar transport system permease protein
MTERRSFVQTVLVHIALIAMIVGGVFPAVWLFLTSLKTDGELVRLPITYLPDTPTLLTYVEVFQQNPFGRFLLNSLVVSLSATVICVLFAGLAGYALARLNVPGRKLIMAGIVMTSMVAALVLLGPLYRIFVGVEVPGLSALVGDFEQLGFGFLPTEVRSPNLLSTYWALIIP